MKNRRKEIVFENGEGIRTGASAYSSLPNVLAGEYAKKLSVYTDKDNRRAVIPPRWTVSGVEKENTIWGKNKSLVIYRIPENKVEHIDWTNSNNVEFLKRKYHQFSWVPVDLLDANGTLDGVSFNEKFGRRNYQNVQFSDDAYNEPFDGELIEQVECVKKYGGFYISCYEISKNEKGKPQSVKGVMPWVNINSDDAKKVATTIECNKVVKSHLPFGAEYDSVLEWFIKTKTRTDKEIVEGSTNWGNHWNTKNSPRKISQTGGSKKWCTNNIYDFAGNVDEWTQENYKSCFQSIRGGGYNYNGDYYPVACRRYSHFFYMYNHTGFRVALYIK